MTKTFKTFVPQGLFGRSLIILIAPVLLIQIVTTYIFTDRHLDKVTQLLSFNVAAKIAGGIDVLTKMSTTADQFPLMQRYIWQRYDLELVPTSWMPSLSLSASRLPYRCVWLKRALQSQKLSPFELRIQSDYFYVQIKTVQGSFVFRDQLKHLYPRTTSLLMWWSILTPLFLLIISTLFLKNQIRPLRRLSKVVDRFGRGEANIPLKPTGSYEVRNLTENFNAMCIRIKHHLQQRTQMLAEVSHDLRTPLTRMELQLTMMAPSREVEQLHEDVREMTHMIEEFLAFSQGEEGEEIQDIPLKAFLEKTTSRYEGHRMLLDLPLNELIMRGRPHGLRRCLTNLINNAMKYAKTLKITLRDKPVSEMAEILIDDDGPGIPVAARAQVLTPFFRLEESRNSETGGVGLGLAIAQDIVQGHGGTIELETSPQGGLRVRLRFPLKDTVAFKP